MSNNRLVKDKLALLELAGKLNNVSAACKAMTFSRDSFYRFKKAYDQGGPDALSKKGYKATYHKKRISSDVEDAVIKVSLKDPLLGRHKISKLLGEQGIKVSPAGVRYVWECHDMLTVEDRVDRLFEHIRRNKEILSEAQIKACRKAIRKRAEPSDMQKNLELKKGILEKRLEFETLISELSANFINLPFDRIDEEIENGQMRVCKALDLHRSAFMEFSADTHLLTLTHKWALPGVPIQYPAALTEEYSYWSSRLLKGKDVFFSDPDELPDEIAGVREYIRGLGVTSALAIPLKVGKNVIGIMDWQSYGIKRQWPKAIIDRLHLVSEVFANALSRKRSEEALRAL
ncbi:MAG: helix-turn-helix domain-containing protein, partial [Deltaproteobacteria bacterium]|nr:helix-turn-helix domain-containing protein [Deltaproteobacteria bacterium]